MTVRVILNVSLHAKKAISDLQRYHLNIRLILEDKELFVFIYQLKRECTLAHSVTSIPRKYRKFYVPSSFHKIRM